MRILFLVVLGLAVVQTGCGLYVTRYTVQNTSREFMMTRGFTEPCDELPGYKGEYLYELAAPPDSTVIYDDYGDEAECIQVYDEQRLTVLTAKYEYQKTYVLPTNPDRGVYAVPDADLTEQGWWSTYKESWQDGPVITAILNGALFVLGGCVLFAVYIVAKHFWNFYFRPRRQPSA